MGNALACNDIRKTSQYSAADNLYMVYESAFLLHIHVQNNFRFALRLEKIPQFSLVYF